MERVILHSDMNNCYANIELLHHPELRGRPLAVGEIRKPDTALCWRRISWRRKRE